MGVEHSRKGSLKQLVGSYSEHLHIWACDSYLFHKDLGTLWTICCAALLPITNIQFCTLCTLCTGRSSIINWVRKTIAPYPALSHFISCSIVVLCFCLLMYEWKKSGSCKSFRSGAGRANWLQSLTACSLSVSLSPSSSGIFLFSAEFLLFTVCLFPPPYVWRRGNSYSCSLFLFFSLSLSHPLPLEPSFSAAEFLIVHCLFPLPHGHFVYLSPSSSRTFLFCSRISYCSLSLSSSSWTLCLSRTLFL